MTTVTIRPALTRTRFTYLTYTLMVFFGAMIAVPGAIMPLIADKLALTNGQMGWHFTASAIGVLLVGLYGDRVANHVGNRELVWGGAALATFALFGLVYAPSMLFSVPFIMLHGVGTGSMAQFATAAIADEYPTNNGPIYAEMNIAGGVGLVVGPIIVGSLERFGAGWASTPVVFALTASVIALAFINCAFPQPRNRAKDGQTIAPKPFPTLFWLLCTVLFLAVAIEWLLFYWTPDFLTEVAGFERTTAVTLISVQGVAMVIGRLIGRRLLMFMSVRRLTLMSFAVIVVFCPVYLYSPLPLLTVVGLFVMGLGIANLFPMGLTQVMQISGDQTGRASARATVAGSSAIVIVPNVVGNLADWVGLRPAMLLIIVFGLAAIAIVGLTAEQGKATQARTS